MQEREITTKWKENDFNFHAMTAIAHSATSLPAEPGIGGVVHRYRWNEEGQTITSAYEVLGEGQPILLLPAMSTVSTRGEMRQIAQQLSPHYQTIALDWIGFGDSERPRLPYQASLYHQFLEDFVRDTFSEPITIIAAGHSAGYAMRLASKQPQACRKVVLVAPTWRGPFTVMGVPSGVSGLIREAVRSPVLGQGLYQLNTASSFLRLMYRRHVYTNADLLTPEFMGKKRQITQQPGARYAPVAFVTGKLDPAFNAEEYLGYFQSVSMPLLVIIAEKAPPSSLAEMEKLVEFPHVKAERVPGSLGLHEEYADAVAQFVLNFI